ncbi:ankyrin repeat-containing domain protein [Mycena capillaripes]|nr:ankyrin repeat-containing domain protein [Mycena capillaripes]
MASGGSHTVNHYVYGGTGGNGGGGGERGGGGGAGEGPTMNYDIQTQYLNLQVVSKSRFLEPLFTCKHSGIQIHGSTLDQQQRSDSEQRTRIIDWLSPINFFLRQADISRVRQAGTGGWLLADPLFKEWESGSGATLWCSGIPGAGKTVLASMVVENLRLKHEQKNIGVACMYLDHKEVENQTPARLLSSLWRQLIFGRDIGSLPKKLHQQHFEMGTTPDLDDVYEVLRSAIRQYSRIYIIVDAIDEYPEDQRFIVLECLALLGSNVNLMITSRPHVAPDASLPNLHALEIRAREEDVRKYVDAQIRKSRLSRHLQARPDLRNELHAKITDNIDGMFLLAKLHIKSLSSKSTIKGVREAMKNLPMDLNDSYDAAMSRIENQNEEDKKIARSTLTWVANAKRPLSTLEIRVALAIELGSRRLDEENLMDIEIILAVCAGLVIVDEQLSVVRLVHYTTQEYLDRIQAQRFPDAQTEITRTLLTVLAFDGFPDPSWTELELETDLPPLVEYSQYCLMHAAGQPDGQLKIMIADFLARAWQWKRTLGFRWNSPPWNFMCWPPQPSAMSIAAAANLLETAKLLLKHPPVPNHPDDLPTSIALYYGHRDMVQLLIENGADVNAQGGPCGGALLAAVQSGNFDMVQMLLDLGGDLNIQGFYGTPLAVASCFRLEAIVQLLLGKGADVNAQCGPYGSALYAAMCNGAENVAELLLVNGADVNMRVDIYGTPLVAASEFGQETLVQLLINNGAHLNAHGDDYGTALTTASSCSRENIVRLLLQKGADVNLLGGPYGTALAAASWVGHENIVRLLLEHGADVNARGGRHNFALHAAVSGGNESISRLLLDNGANVNMQVDSYGTSLVVASALGQESLVQLFIDNGADLDAHGAEYGTALTTACAGGREDIVRLLVQKGADLNVQGGPYEFALYAALNSITWADGAENIARLLIDKGADVNLPVKHYGSVLAAASYFGQETLVQMLVDNGADLDAQGEYGTALSIASWYGRQSIVRLLLEKGASADIVGGSLGSPLHAATWMDSEIIVRMLIDHGADIDTEVQSYGTVLAIASRHGNDQLVQLFINSCANVNIQCGEYGTALIAASFAGHENMVEFLLRNGAKINVRVNKYGSAIEAAWKAGYENIVKLLVRHGAKVGVPETAGESFIE